MSLNVNGLKIKQSSINKIEEITELLSPVIKETILKRAKKDMNSTYTSFIKYLKKENWSYDDPVDFTSFFEKHIYFGVKKEDLSPMYFEKPEKADLFLSFVNSLLTSDLLSRSSYDLKYCPVKDSSNVLIILPFDLDLDAIPESVYTHCTRYSVSNSTDDLYPHFETMDIQEKAIVEWYKTDEMNAYLKQTITVDLPLIDWLKQYDRNNLFVRSNVYDEVCDNHYFKGKDVPLYEKMDFVIDMIEDQEFCERVESARQDKIESCKAILTDLNKCWSE